LFTLQRRQRLGRAATSSLTVAEWVSWQSTGRLGSSLLHLFFFNWLQFFSFFFFFADFILADLGFVDSVLVKW
jgi:hypothetical protein